MSPPDCPACASVRAELAAAREERAIAIADGVKADDAARVAESKHRVASAVTQAILEAIGEPMHGDEVDALVFLDRLASVLDRHRTHQRAVEDMAHGLRKALRGGT